jgi:hypothetical protein
MFKRPPAAIRPAWSRVEGMMLGLAIGDSLGNRSEAQFPGGLRSSTTTGLLRWLSMEPSRTTPC